MEIGKWYKAPACGQALFFVTNIDNNENDVEAYGFNYKGEWRDKEWDFAVPNSPNNIEATKEEIESALIKEAERRGFVEVVKFISPGGRNHGYVLNDNGRLTYRFTDNVLCWSKQSQPDGIGYYIMSDGQWAEIVEEPKPESMRVQLTGNNIEKVPDTDYNKPIKAEKPTITVLDTNRKELGKIYRTNNKYYLHISNEIVECSSVEDCLTKID